MYLGTRVSHAQPNQKPFIASHLRPASRLVPVFRTGRVCDGSYAWAARTRWAMQQLAAEICASTIFPPKHGQLLHPALLTLMLPQ